MDERYRERAEQHRAEIVGFAAQLIRTPSPSGQEGAIANLVAERMRSLGYDDVFLDEVGNVVGVIRGTGKGRDILFCSHLDTAEPGDLELWEEPPFSGTEEGDALLGLGASTSKGSLAAQVHAASLLKEENLAGNLIVAGIVMSERSEGFGISHLFDRTLPSRQLKPSLVVMGDPTGLDLFLGQRGRMEIEVMTIGRTSHASVPWLGVNAVYKMTSVVEGLHELATTLPSHPFLEKSTLALTELSCTPARPSTIPDRCVALLDRRYLPTESLDTILMQVQSLLNKASVKDPEFKGEARIRSVKESAYTGLVKEVPKVLAPFMTSEAHPLVSMVVEALEAQGDSPQFDKWYYSTEAGYPAGILGIPTIGYAPGEEKYAHTPYDRVKIVNLLQAAAGYAAIARVIAGDEDGQEE